MKTAIVSGANGFVGGAVCRELLAHGYEVWAVDREGCRGNIPEDATRCHFVACDLAEIGLLMNKIPQGAAETLYHFAWMGSAGPMRTDTEIQLRNAQWTVDTIRAAAAMGCSRIVCAGSVMEYEALAAAGTPGTRPGMGYVYGAGKLVAHIMGMSVAASLGIDLLWAEITNAYGPGERSPRLVNTTIRKCIAGEQPRFTAGTQRYDFVYIDDVARAFRMIGEKGKPFHSYLIGSSKARPLKEFLLEMQQAIAPGLEFVFGEVPFTGIDLPLERFDCSQTERDTGFRAKIPFAEGCRRTHAWWKAELGKDAEA